MTVLQTFHIPDTVTGTAADIELAQRMVQAWRRDGIFQVATDDIQSRKTETAFEASRRFFRLPMQVKAGCVSDLSYTGYIASGEEITAGEADYSEIYIGAHTDYGLLVIAAQDDVGGLYIRPPVEGETRKRNWLPDESSAGMYENEAPWTFVKPVPNVLTVFPGDIMQFMTGGRLLSTPHKVRLNTRERFALAYFHEPNFQACARPLFEPQSRDTSTTALTSRTCSRAAIRSASPPCASSARIAGRCWRG